VHHGRRRRAFRPVRVTALAWADSVSNVSSRAVEVPDGSDGAPDGGSEPVGAMHQLSDTSDVIDTSAGR